MAWVALVGGIIIGFMLGIVGMCFMVNRGLKRTREELGENDGR